MNPTEEVFEIREMLKRNIMDQISELTTVVVEEAEWPMAEAGAVIASVMLELGAGMAIGLAPTQEAGEALVATAVEQGRLTAQAAKEEPPPVTH